VIYFIQVNRRGPVKIGFTVGGARSRLTFLQCATHLRLHLRATISGTRARERELHKQFKRYRIRGEWFKYEGDLEKYLKELPRAVRPPRYAPWTYNKQNRLLSYIKRFNKNHGYCPSYAEMAKAFRLKSSSAIHRLIIGLEHRGLIKRMSHLWRAIEVVRR